MLPLARGAARPAHALARLYALQTLDSGAPAAAGPGAAAAGGPRAPLPPATAATALLGFAGAPLRCAPPGRAVSFASFRCFSTSPRETGAATREAAAKAAAAASERALAAKRGAQPPRQKQTMEEIHLVVMEGALKRPQGEVGARGRGAARASWHPTPTLPHAAAGPRYPHTVRQACATAARIGSRRRRSSA